MVDLGEALGGSSAQAVVVEVGPVDAVEGDPFQRRRPLEVQQRRHQVPRHQVAGDTEEHDALLEVVHPPIIEPRCFGTAVLTL